MVKIDPGEARMIVISGRGLTVSESLEAPLTRKIHLSISGRLEHVDRVTAKLTNLDDPARGIDKRCRIRVRLCCKSSAMAAATDSDLDAAMDQALRGKARA